MKYTAWKYTNTPTALPSGIQDSPFFSQQDLVIRYFPKCISWLTSSPLLHEGIKRRYFAGADPGMAGHGGLPPSALVCLSATGAAAGERRGHRRVPAIRHEPGRPRGAEPEVSQELSRAAKGVPATGQRPRRGGGERGRGKKPAVRRTAGHENGAGNQPVPQHFLPAGFCGPGNQGAVFRPDE